MPKLPTIAMLLLLVAGPAGAADDEPVPRPLDGAESLLEVPYLPEHRYTGDPGARRDHQLMLNLYLPEQSRGPTPLILLVHGGGFGGGDKDKGRHPPARELLKAAIARGWACGSLNYILSPKSLCPQVVYDFRDALRYLRAHADELRLDPARFGAIGFSAGGWLISAAGYAHGDRLLRKLSNSIAIEDLASGGKRGRAWRVDHAVFGKGEATFYWPALNPRPGWPGHYGQVQAISFDFSWHRGDDLSGQGPATNQWTGRDYTPDDAERFASLGMDFSQSVLAAEKYRGKGVHVPGLDKPALARQGSDQVTLGERVLQFFDQQFGPRARCPIPAIHPGLRIIDGPTEVRILVPTEDITVHLTTDGSEPSTASPVYQKSFTITGETLVKALAVREGMRPSLVATGHFIPGPPPPRIVEPDTRHLPEARLGEVYELRFGTDVDGPLVWRLGGEIGPYQKRHSDEWALPIGLGLDEQRGILRGTPTAPGTYWVQIRVGRGVAQVGGLRNYLLTVRGEGEAATAGRVGADPYVELGRARLEAAQCSVLIDALRGEGIAAISHDDGKEVLVLVPRKDLERAGQLVERAEAAGSIPKLKR